MDQSKKLDISKSMALFETGKKLIPGGVSGIRRPYNFVEGEYPIFIEKGKGGRITDIDGNEYIDFLCAYGPIIFGYREKEIDDAVIRQIKDKGFCFSLTQKYQNELAEKFKELIPCSEMTIFVKTGSDATTTAIRLARAFTNRTDVMRCGYHGWHDWCVEVKGGIPDKLFEDVHEFRYNDLDSLESLMKVYGSKTAAIIITPLGHELGKKMKEPSPGFLKNVKSIASKYGAVLIFDEIRTGFRMSMGGAQQYYGVTPDVACFGKAMANGYPISAVTGKAAIMKKGENEVFISSTFFSNSIPFVASLKTIEIMERDDILKKIWKKGENFLLKSEKAVNQYNVGAELSGVGPMFFITFQKDDQKVYKKRRLEFYAQLIRKGIFMHPYHHGYLAYRHTNVDLNKTVSVIREALAHIENKFGQFI